MNIAAKYGKSYFMPPEVTYDWVKKDSIEKPPVCAAWICGMVSRR